MNEISRRKYGTINRYIAREYMLSFVVCFFFFFVVFLVNQLLLLAQKILEKRAPVWDVIMLLVYALPMIVALAVPFAVLVGALMAVGRMSSDNEILVMLASGIPLRRIFLPFVMLSMLFASASFVTNDILLPMGTINYVKLLQKLITSTPAFIIQPFTSRDLESQGITIVNGAVENGIIKDILIFDVIGQAKSRVISAKSAKFN